VSFESGAIGFRMFYVGREFSKDAVKMFGRYAAPTLDKLGTDPVHGWVGGRHLLDVPITENNAFFGGHLRLILMKAERKVPAALLRAECMLEELAHMQAEGKAFVDRKTRSEIRKEVLNRLLPQMPPTLKGISFVHDERAGIVYSTATSENQMDAFCVNFQKATGLDLIPVTADTLIAKLRKINPRDLSLTSFSPEVADEEMEDAPGQDFLTWLWFASEARGGIFKSKDHGNFAVALEGPLGFQRSGAGAHEITLRKGLPTVSAEAKTALLSGKKLRRARLMLGCEDEAWAWTFDADTFVFRSLKLPEPKEMLDPSSRFQDRMIKLGMCREFVFDLFERFLNDRCDAKKWSATKKEIHQWVMDRDTKK
jgi:hypothetical protein